MDETKDHAMISVYRPVMIRWHLPLAVGFDNWDMAYLSALSWWHSHWESFLLLKITGKFLTCVNQGILTAEEAVCLNLCIHVITCHITSTGSGWHAHEGSVFQFWGGFSSQERNLCKHQHKLGIFRGQGTQCWGVPLSYSDEKQNLSGRCLWAPKWAFSHCHPQFHNSALTGKHTYMRLKGEEIWVRDWGDRETTLQEKWLCSWGIKNNR